MKTGDGQAPQPDDEDCRPGDVVPMPKQTPRPKPKTKQTKAPDPTEEIENLVSTLTQQKKKSSDMQDQITGYLNQPAPISQLGCWGTWLGMKAEEIAPDLLPQFYHKSFELVMGLVEQMQKRQQKRQQSAQTQQQQHPVSQTSLPQGGQQQYQQYQQPVMHAWPQPYQPGTSAGAAMWDTAGPTVGQPAASQIQLPPRPSSTPNMSFSLIENDSSLSLSNILTPSINQPDLQS